MLCFSTLMHSKAGQLNRGIAILNFKSSVHVLFLPFSRRYRTRTYLFKKNGTLYFFDTIETINHIDLIFSGIHIFPCPHVSCKLGYNIPRNKVTATILVKDTKTVLKKSIHINISIFNESNSDQWFGSIIQ